METPKTIMGLGLRVFRDPSYIDPLRTLDSYRIFKERLLGSDPEAITLVVLNLRMYCTYHYEKLLHQLSNLMQ